MKTDDHQIQVPAAIFGKEAKASSVPRGYEILSQHDSVGSDWGPDWLRVMGSFQWDPSKSGHTHDPVYLWYPVLSRSTQSVVLIRFLDVGRDANGRPHSLRAEAAFLDISDEEMQRTLLSSLLAGNVDWTLSKSDEGPILTIAFSKVAADDLSSNADPTRPVLIAPLPVSIQTSLDLEGWKLLTLGSGASFSDREVASGHFRESSKNTSPPRETSAPRHGHMQPSQVRLPHTPTFWERNGWKFFAITSLLLVIMTAIFGYSANMYSNYEKTKLELSDLKSDIKYLTDSNKELNDFDIRKLIDHRYKSDEKSPDEYRDLIRKFTDKEKKEDEFDKKLTDAPRVSDLLDSLRNTGPGELRNLDDALAHIEPLNAINLREELTYLASRQSSPGSDEQLESLLLKIIANYDPLKDNYDPLVSQVKSLQQILEQFMGLLSSIMNDAGTIKEHDSSSAISEIPSSDSTTDEGMGDTIGESDSNSDSQAEESKAPAANFSDESDDMSIAGESPLDEISE